VSLLTNLFRIILINLSTEQYN